MMQIYLQINEPLQLIKTANICVYIYILFIHLRNYFCGFGQVEADEWMEFTKDAANATKNRTADATQSAKESAQHGKEQSASFLQQVCPFFLRLG